jgi:hypothetical protein
MDRTTGQLWPAEEIFLSQFKILTAMDGLNRLALDWHRCDVSSRRFVPVVALSRAIMMV